MKADKHPDIMKYIPSIGSTHEGREMPAVHLTASKDPNRKKVYMQCQIHAREFKVFHSGVVATSFSSCPLPPSISLCKVEVFLHVTRIIDVL